MNKLACILLLALAVPVAAADAAFDGSGYRLTLPAGWTHDVRDDIHVHRSPDGKQSITVGVYEVAPVVDNERRRTVLMTKAAELRRAMEVELGSARLRLTPISSEREGDLLQLDYSGEDPSTGRRFANLMISSPRWLQNYYFESVGGPAPRLERVGDAIFGGLETGPAGGAPLSCSSRSGRCCLLASCNEFRPRQPRPQVQKQLASELR